MIKYLKYLFQIWSVFLANFLRPSDPPWIVYYKMSLWVDKYRPSDFSTLSYHPETTATLKDLVQISFIFGMLI